MIPSRFLARKGARGMVVRVRRISSLLGQGTVDACNTIQVANVGTGGSQPVGSQFAVKKGGGHPPSC